MRGPSPLTDLRQRLQFIAAGIGNLIPDEPDDETSVCPECGEPSPCAFERDRE